LSNGENQGSKNPETTISYVNKKYELIRYPLVMEIVKLENFIFNIPAPRAKRTFP
jgi:hypothetical protein